MSTKRKIKNIHPLREPTARELFKIADQAIEDASAEDVYFPVNRGLLADLLAAGVRDLFEVRAKQAAKRGIL